MKPEFIVRAKVWVYNGKAAWHFVTLSKKQSRIINKLFSDLKRGFGSLRVKVTIGTTTWKTSIFPDKKNGTYLLPIKVAVRKAEGIAVGKTITLSFTIIGV